MAIKDRFPTLHRDGTISYWSMLSQEWIERAFHVPLEEIESMSEYDQQRVKKHLLFDRV